MPADYWYKRSRSGYGRHKFLKYLFRLRPLSTSCDFGYSKSGSNTFRFTATYLITATAQLSPSVDVLGPCFPMVFQFPNRLVFSITPLGGIEPATFDLHPGSITAMLSTRRIFKLNIYFNRYYPLDCSRTQANLPAFLHFFCSDLLFLNTKIIK